MLITTHGQIARIELQSPGLFAVCDADQIERPLSVWFRNNTSRQFRVVDLTWYAHRQKHATYVIAREGGAGEQIAIRLHRLLTEAGPSQVVDHRDRNGLNNLRQNLRICDASRNVAWAKLPQGNLPRGVSYVESLHRFRARITVNYRPIHLGLFDDAISAASAYDAAARLYFGDFARCNDLQPS